MAYTPRWSMAALETRQDRSALTYSPCIWKLQDGCLEKLPAYALRCRVAVAVYALL
jgi:hypothetical protein